MTLIRTLLTYDGDRVSGFGLSDGQYRAVSFSYVTLPPETPLTVASGLLNGELVMGSELGTHSVQPLPDRANILVPCVLLPAGQCLYDAGPPRMAVETCRIWLNQGGSHDQMWQFLENYFRVIFMTKGAGE